MKLPVPAQVESQALLICECNILVDYTEDLLLYMLVIGVAASELQENLLKEKKLNLSVSKKVPKKQAEIIGDSAG